MMRYIIFSITGIVLILSVAGCLPYMYSPQGFIYPTGWYHIATKMPFKFGDTISSKNVFDEYSVYSSDSTQVHIFFPTGDYLYKRLWSKQDFWGVYTIDVNKDGCSRVIKTYVIYHWMFKKVWSCAEQSWGEYDFVDSMLIPLYGVREIAWNKEPNNCQKKNLIKVDNPDSIVCSIDSSYARQQKWMWRDKKEWKKWMESHPVKIAIPDD